MFTNRFSIPSPPICISFLFWILSNCWIGLQFSWIQIPLHRYEFNSIQLACNVIFSFKWINYHKINLFFNHLAWINKYQGVMKTLFYFIFCPLKFHHFIFKNNMSIIKARGRA
jgi:hypothetical protein